MSGLRVPVLVHAYPDSLDQMDVVKPPRQLLRQDFRLQQLKTVRI